MRARFSFTSVRLCALLFPVILSPVILSMVAFAQQSAIPQPPAQQTSPAAPRPLIAQPIDESQLTVLRGNTHPLARPEFDLGTAPATLSMQRMLLVLKRSPEQESALGKLLDDQQDKSSPSYHKWLTPEDFGSNSGQPTPTSRPSPHGCKRTDSKWVPPKAARCWNFPAPPARCRKLFTLRFTNTS